MIKNFNRIILLAVLIMANQLVDAQTIKKWKLKDLENAIANASQPTIFNFWATFCKPCIAEMPYFQEVAAKYKEDGVKLIFVNIDASEAYPKKIQAFATKRKIKAPIVFLDETNADLFCPAVDPSWSGSIPATLFINQNKGYRNFFEDEMTKEKFEEEVKNMLLPK
ncbi:MAG TPA: TlpA disulfide reductase family protein [Flavisolibacter sp.]|nr:TlpA disulfide reductase family protein [Flavisolibacter sp.]